jgi:hypothetical protein
MQKITEKELLRLIRQINGHRERVGKNALFLTKITRERKLQNRHMYYLKCLQLYGENYGVFEQVTPILSGQALSNYLNGILEGIFIGMKIASYIENTNGSNGDIV